MRINWFSPLPPARTDIANYTARILPALAQHAEVRLWTPQNEWDPELEAHAKIHSCLPDSLHWIDLSFADHTVYQIGNDHRFHGPILKHAEKHGGTIVLHDINVHEMQRMRYIDQQSDPMGYLTLLATYEGADGVLAGRQTIRKEISVDDAARSFPLTQSVTTGAHGVIVHNPAQVEYVRDRSRAPVGYVPLPYREPSQLPPVLPRTLTATEPVQMVMFGFLHGTNRRLIPFLRAWASMDDRAHYRLTLIGEIAHTEELKAQIEAIGLSKYVRILGYVPEKELDAELAQAHLAINLRYPTRGEASGAMLRIWSHALPCLVTDLDYFAGLPDSTVLKIDPNHESQDIQNALNEFRAKPECVFEIGSNGRKYLETHHSPESYVENLLSFLSSASAYKPQACLDRYLPRIAHQFIASIPESLAQNHWIERISQEVPGWFSRSYQLTTKKHQKPASQES